MTNAELIAIGIAAADKQFALSAYEASGLNAFKELADGKPGPSCQKVREWLNSRHGWNRVSSAWLLREAVLRSLKEKRNTEDRTEALAALLSGDTRGALEAIQGMIEKPKPKTELKVRA